MIGQGPIRDEDLHGFIDGELPADRAELVAAALEADPVLAARVEAFAADKAALAAAFRPVTEEALPAAWIARIEQAARPVAVMTPRRAVRRPRLWAMALAASIVLAIGGVTLLQRSGGGADTILAQAESARQSRTAPLTMLAGAALADGPARDALITHAVGLNLRAPDLARLGWQLAEIDAYPAAAALRYRATDGRALTLYVRKSSGTPRFDLLRNGAVRTCIWQDEVVGAVMMGEMSAGQMMRVASAAYVALNL
jgi:anti-sigma factor RsiW